MLEEGTTHHQVMYFLASERVRSTHPFGSADDKNHMILEDVTHSVKKRLEHISLALIVNRMTKHERMCTISSKRVGVVLTDGRNGMLPEDVVHSVKEVWNIVAEHFKETVL